MTNHFCSFKKLEWWDRSSPVQMKQVSNLTMLIILGSDPVLLFSQQNNLPTLVFSPFKSYLGLQKSHLFPLPNILMARKDWHVLRYRLQRYTYTEMDKHNL
uniref:Uncharacterized protein n=1 Tax=Sphaerodactylus townsendi TaxID=933632 RepID=A0ACB8FXS2_9SAUR